MPVIISFLWFPRRAIGTFAITQWGPSMWYPPLGGAINLSLWELTCHWASHRSLVDFFCSEGCGKSRKNDSFFSQLPISHPHPMPKAPWSGFFISIKVVVVIVPHTRWLLLEMTREIALHIRPLCQVQWSKNKEMFTLHKPAQYHHLCIFWGFLCPPPALTASEHLHATGSLKGAPESRILFFFLDFFYFMPFFPIFMGLTFHMLISASKGCLFACLFACAPSLFFWAWTPSWKGKGSDLQPVVLGRCPSAGVEKMRTTGQLCWLELSFYVWASGQNKSQFADFKEWRTFSSPFFLIPAHQPSLWPQDDPIRTSYFSTYWDSSLMGVWPDPFS